MLIEELRHKHPKHWENATAIRVLTLDAVAAANSGHSGMPMGMADVATVLFFNHLKFDPKAPLGNEAYLGSFNRRSTVITAGICTLTVCRPPSTSRVTIAASLSTFRSDAKVACDQPIKADSI